MNAPLGLRFSTIPADPPRAVWIVTGQKALTLAYLVIIGEHSRMGSGAKPGRRGWSPNWPPTYHKPLGPCKPALHLGGEAHITYSVHCSQAQQRAASATGRLASGEYIKDATQHAKDMASTEYDNFLRSWYQSLTPWQSMAGIDMTTAEQLGKQAVGTAEDFGRYQLYSGQAGEGKGQRSTIH